jgi:hypothetical protein
VGDALEKHGYQLDAVHVFDLIGNYDKVLLILNEHLGKVLNASASGGSNERQLVVNVANRFVQSRGQGEITLHLQRQILWDTFNQLLALIYFFDLYNSNRYQDALTVREQCGW